MIMRLLLLIVCFFAVASCTKSKPPESVFLECESIAANYKEYNGETIACQFYWTLASIDNQLFLELNSHCADLVRPFVINENCEDICAESPFSLDSECAQYLSRRELHEIIFISK